MIGKKTIATGPDPDQTFDFRFKLIPLANIIASHDETVTANPKFPKELQPRLRDRKASRKQIVRIASKLNPDALLSDLHTLDRGPIIVGSDDVVESGNGRAIALKLASIDFRPKFADYQRELRGRAREFGLDASDFQGIRNPVLVRERLTKVDRVKFAAIANQSATLTMSPAEQALQDAKSISNEALASITVSEAQGIDQALRSSSNKPIVSAFLRGIPDNEQAALLASQGELNQIGIARVKAAVFAKVFRGASGQRLTQTFFESIDPTIRNVEAATFDSLPAIAKADGLAQSGQRNADLAIGEDFANAVDVMARLKQQGVTVEDFVSQSGFLERELDTNQEKVLIFLDEFGRSRKAMRQFFKDYANTVINSPPPNQAAFFPTAQESKSEIIERLIQQTRKETGGGTIGLFALAEERERVQGFARTEAPKAATPTVRGQRLEEPTTKPIAPRTAPQRPTTSPSKPKPRPESTVKGITERQARQHFGKVAVEKSLDRRKTAKVVAPAVAKTDEDVRLQKLWLSDTSIMDFEGVDTKHPRKAPKPKRKRKAVSTVKGVR